MKDFTTEMKEVIKKPFHHDELKALVRKHALRLENEKNKKYNLLPSTEGIYYFKASIQLYDLTIYQITLNSNS
jgi:hypothetical protein